MRILSILSPLSSNRSLYGFSLSQSLIAFTIFSLCSPTPQLIRVTFGGGAGRTSSAGNSLSLPDTRAFFVAGFFSSSGTSISSCERFYFAVASALSDVVVVVRTHIYVALVLRLFFGRPRLGVGLPGFTTTASGKIFIPPLLE